MSSPLFRDRVLFTGVPAPDRRPPTEEEDEEQQSTLIKERKRVLIDTGSKMFQAKKRATEHAHNAYAETDEPPKPPSPLTRDEGSLLLGGPQRFEDQYRDNDTALMMTLAPTENKPNPQTQQPNKIRDTVNFLLGDDMAILGMKWDEEGLQYGFDIAMEQWSEHPVMSTISALGLAASFIFPVAGAARKSAKVGLLAQKGMTPGSSILRTVDTTAKFRRADEIKAMAREVNELGEAKFFNPKMNEKILNSTPEEVEKMVSSKVMKKSLLREDHMNRFMELKNKVESGTATPFQNLRYSLKSKFSNTWFQDLNNPRRHFIQSWDDYFTSAGIGGLLAAAPDAKHGKSIYKFLSGIIDEDGLRAAGLTDDEIRWSATLADDMVTHQKKMLDKGFISQEEFDRFVPFGSRHTPALHKKTPGALDFSADETTLKVAKGGKVTSTKQRSLGKLLSSPTLKQRRKHLTQEDVLQDLDKFITDPKELTLAGLVRDKQLYHGYSFLKDLAIQAGSTGPLSHYVKTSDQMLSMGKSAAKQWVSLDEIPVAGAANRLRRMIEKETGQSFTGRLPFVHKSVIDDFFGDEGILGQTMATGSALEVLTAIHKTSRTAMNPATHMQNAAGNFFGFLPMAGYNLLNPMKAKERLNDGKVISKTFWRAAKQITDEKKKVDEVFSYDNLKQLFTDVNGSHMMKAKWGDIDLAEFFSHKAMLRTMEESAFDSVEGFGRVRKIMEGLENMESKGMLREPGQTLTKNIASLFTKVTEGTKAEWALHRTSSLYLAEDAIPKMMYALDLAKGGLSMDQVVLEVGRRLPQYQSVGSWIGSSRRHLLPWISFPSEAARIMKNNILDEPIKMMPWLQLPHMMQGFASSVGIAPDISVIDDMRKAAPKWADKPTTVLLNSEAAAPALGGFTGAVVGGLTGMAKRGALGATLGAAAGAAGGAGISEIANEAVSPEEQEDKTRAWVMDFLPWSAVLPSTTSEYAEPINAQDMVDLSPIEPFAVVMPLINVVKGEGSFGQQITTRNSFDAMSKATLGLMGFLSPPLLQKYGMKLTGPGGTFIPMPDALDDAGGHHVVARRVPKSATAATGAAVGGLLGGMAGGKLGAGKVAGAAIGVTIGGLSGASLNTRRIMQDAGIVGNPYTKVPGNPIFDIAFNSFAGLPKSWEVNPEQQLVNERFRETKYQEIRTSLTKELDDAINRGDEGATNTALERIHKSFLTQYANPTRAQNEFLQWEMRHVDQIGRIPALRRFSKEDLLRKLIEASEFAKTHRGKHAKNMIQLIQQELIARRIGNMPGGGGRGGRYGGFGGRY